jgi:hypothetical protein
MDFKGLDECPTGSNINWSKLTNDFVLNKRTDYIADFINKVHGSKVESEK